MDAKLTGSLREIIVVLIDDFENEMFLEFVDGLFKKYSVRNHLVDQIFKVSFHNSNWHKDNWGDDHFSRNSSFRSINLGAPDQ